MITIHKYPFQIADEQPMSTPFGSQILHVGLDPSGAPCIWAKVDTDKSMDDWQLFVVDTGNPIPAGAVTYIGSFAQGPSVRHVFTS